MLPENAESLLHEAGNGPASVAAVLSRSWLSGGRGRSRAAPTPICWFSFTRGRIILSKRRWPRISEAAVQELGCGLLLFSDTLPRMRTTCLICRHEQRDKIESQLLTGKSTRGLAVEFSLSRSSLERHYRLHLKPTPSQSIIPVSQVQEAPSQERATSSLQPSRISLNQPDPWERQRGETRVAFAAFEAYLRIATQDPTHDATYDQAAQAVGKNKSLISRWGRTLRGGLTWRQRVDAWLQYVDRARAARLLHETTQARDRWAEQGRTLQRLGSQRLAGINPAKLPQAEARRFVVDGAMLEGRGLAMDGSKVSLQVNQTSIAIDPEVVKRISQTYLARHRATLTGKNENDGSVEIEAVPTKPPGEPA
jgi:hypothetical protein